MRSFLLAIAAMLLLSGVIIAAPQRPETLRVKVDHAKTAVRSRINVRFVKMIEDSRCPRDVQCIQAGEAKIRIRVSRGRRADVLILSTEPRNGVASFGGYEFQLLRLTPEPRSNIRINPNGYVATIQIIKK